MRNLTKLLHHPSPFTTPKLAHQLIFHPLLIRTSLRCTPGKGRLLHKEYTQEKRNCLSLLSHKRKPKHSLLPLQNSPQSLFQPLLTFCEENIKVRGNLDEEPQGISALERVEIDVSDEGNEGDLVPYNEELDISKFVLVPSQNDPLTDEIKLKRESIRRQLQIEDDRLTARGVPDDEKLVRYIRLFRKLMPAHVKPLQTTAPLSSQNHVSSSSTSTSEHSSKSPIHQTLIPSYHPSQTKPTSPHRSPPSLDLNQTPIHSSDNQITSDPHSSTLKDHITTMSHPTTTSSIHVPLTAIPQSISIPTSFPTQ